MPYVCLCWLRWFDVFSFERVVCRLYTKILLRLYGTFAAMLTLAKGRHLLVFWKWIRESRYEQLTTNLPRTLRIGTVAKPAIAYRCSLDRILYTQSRAHIH